MESEKVKEIKDKLQEEIFIANSFGDKLRKVPTNELENLLTLINELESENDTLHTNLCEWRKENQQLKDRIAELEKEIAIKTDTIVDLLKKQEFYEKEKLTKFAERLKSKDCSVPIHKGFILIEDHAIDETLKEFINKGDDIK